MDSLPNRAGQYVRQISGYKAYIPTPLPPTPPLTFDSELIKLLSTADLNLGQLKGLASIISDPDLFVYLYVRKEALLSSQIEGTQCSLEDILSAEPEHSPKKVDIEEVSNYVAAMNEGLRQLSETPVSTRLLKQIHSILMRGVRGANKSPGEYRTSQNWIGHPNATLHDAQFVPPPPEEVSRCMSELEIFIHENDDHPKLIQAALVHAQFETIHPFLDGNGRLGRLLITFLLCHWGVIQRPLLYLSYFFKANRTEYYSRLTAIRERGDWEGWIKFFLRGVAETAQMANAAAIQIHNIHKQDLEKIQAHRITPLTSQIFHLFCRDPIMTAADIRRITNATKPSIQRGLDKLLEIEIITETTGRTRNKRYVYDRYLQILTRDTQTKIG